MKELRPKERGGPPLLSKKRFAQFCIRARDLTMAFVQEVEGAEVSVFPKAGCKSVPLTGE